MQDDPEMVRRLRHHVKETLIDLAADYGLRRAARRGITRPC
ncbi:hypothetical protein [Pseudooceanicola lipolyticus]|nr:hypothetical protein [Pseudooceanicola lipolyticus]